MKKIIGQIIQWGAAVMVGAIIMNVLLYPYNRTTGWIDRDGGATLAIYKPNSNMLRSTEGRGYHKIDKRGYVNDIDALADGYNIVIGASFTQGKEVQTNERYTDLLNNWLGYTEEAYVYNVSQDAYYFPKIVKGFTALVSEFPDANRIIIEIATTSYNPEELSKSLEQRTFKEEQTGERIMAGLSAKKKISMCVKQYSPLVYNINEKIKSIKALQTGDNSDSSEKEEPLSLDSYETELSRVFEMFQSVYDGEIIILYHPSAEIDKDGNLELETHDTDEAFFETCQRYNIKYVDMSSKFMEEYEENHVVPYGFMNTTMCSGHLNKDGHRMIAEELIKVIR